MKSRNFDIFAKFALNKWISLGLPKLSWNLNLNFHSDTWKTQRLGGFWGIRPANSEHLHNNLMIAISNLKTQRPEVLGGNPASGWQNRKSKAGHQPHNLNQFFNFIINMVIWRMINHPPVNTQAKGALRGNGGHPARPDAQAVAGLNNHVSQYKLGYCLFIIMWHHKIVIRFGLKYIDDKWIDYVVRQAMHQYLCNGIYIFSFI